MKKTIVKKLRLMTILIGFISTFLISWAQISTNDTIHEFLHRLNVIIYDTNIKIGFHQKLNDPQVVIVDIDEKSLKTLGRWPWSRNTISKLVQKLQDNYASVIGFDVIFAEPEQNAVDILADSKHLSFKTRQELKMIRSYFDYDKLLATTLGKSDSVLSYTFLNNQDVKKGKLPPPIADIKPREIKDVLLHNMSGYVTSLSQFQDNSFISGFVSYFRDKDGITRNFPLILKYNGQLYSSFALQVAGTFLLDDVIKVNFQHNKNYTPVESVEISGYKIPTNAVGEVSIPFYGKERQFKYISAADVLTLPNKKLQQLIANKIVLIGPSAIGLADLKATPVSVAFPGVELQANVIQGIITKQIPSKPYWGNTVILLTIALLGFLLSLIFPFCKPFLMVILSLISLAGLFLINLYSWVEYGFIFDIATLILLVLWITIINFLYGFVFSRSQHGYLKAAFAQYIPKQHINAIEKQPDSFTLDGENRELTVLFCDIRSFTSISESLSASQVKEFLNMFLSPMTKIIFDNDGTIDKYVGDMIMAFWGAPLPNENHRECALKTALEMLKKLQNMQDEFKELNIPQVKIGIGLNSGEMNVGDMGSIYRRSYTVLGDNVNLGSRLESATKQYGLDILVSEYTADPLMEKWIFRKVDKVKVKGKNKPVVIYEPIGLESTISDKTLRDISDFHKAQSAYFEQNWSQARELLEVLNNDSHQKIYSLYLERIENFIINPPGIDWDGSVSLPK